jgi:hypothetical protein
MVTVRFSDEAARYEAVPRHALHRCQHPGIIHAAQCDLIMHHARPFAPKPVLACPPGNIRDGTHHARD